MLRRWDSRPWVLSSAVFFLALFAVYLKTHAASLYLDDSGETVTAAALLGIGHPPGYPLHTLLGHAWLSLPLAGLSPRLNLLAALCGALSATLLFAWLSRRRPEAVWVAVAAAALYALGPVFWHNALGAKGSIYQLNNLFSVAMLALLAWDDNLSLARVRAFWLCFGLGLAHHYMSQAPMLPAYALLLLFIPGAPKRWQRWSAAWLALPGISIYAYLFLRTPHHPGLDWGAINTWADFKFFFFRLQYAAAEGTRSLNGSVRQGAHALLYLWREGSYVLLPASLAAFVALRQQRLVQALGAAWLLSLAAVVFYLNLTPERIEIMRPYLFPAYLCQAALAALGGMHVLQRVASNPRLLLAAGLICAMLPLGALAWNYQNQDLSRYFFAQDNARNLLRALPKNAMVFAQGDSIIFPLWFAQRVEGRRPDVAVVGNAVLPMQWVRDDLQRRHPDILQPRVIGPVGSESVNRLVQVLVEMNAGKRPLYTAYNKLEGAIPGWHLVSEGAVYRLARDSEPLPKDPGPLPRNRLSTSVIRGYTQRPMDGRTLKLIVGDFAIHHNGVGVGLEESGRFEEALVWFRQAGRIYPESPDYPFNQGNVWNALKRPDEAVAAYKAAAQADPSYSAAWYNLGVTQYQRGRRDEAIAAFRQVLKLEPGRRDIVTLLQQIGAGPS